MGGALEDEYAALHRPDLIPIVRESDLEVAEEVSRSGNRLLHFSSLVPFEPDPSVAEIDRKEGETPPPLHRIGRLPTLLDCPLHALLLLGVLDCFGYRINLFYCQLVSV